MLDIETKRRIDTARDILVGKVPDPKSQVEQITIAMIHKFMDDMDAESEEFGGQRKFFAGDFARYGWAKLMHSGLGGNEVLNLYSEAIVRMPENPGIPPLFRNIFKNAYLPYRDPETLRAFLKVIDGFTYDHSERLGDAFEYLLSVLGSQGKAGQFRTPRHIIDFIVEIVDPKKGETILDPACGTAGFLISAYRHILRANTDGKGNSTLTPDERGSLAQNFRGYDISPDMVRLSLVNMYLHGFVDPHIYEYDTLTNQDRWNEHADVILANPPFMSPKGGIKPHSRFSVQARRSEILFVDYIAEHLTPCGRAGVIVPEGVIFQTQNAHVSLRKMLVEDYLVAVISLPAGVFNPYSGVKTSILILDRSLAKRSRYVAFFKVESDGFDLGAQRRTIERNDLPDVKNGLTKYLARLRTGEPVENLDLPLGHLVEKAIIANSAYILTGDRYVERQTYSSEYSFVELKKVCDINPSQIDPADLYRGSFFHYIDISSVENQTGTFLGARKVMSEEAPSRARRCVQEDDVLLSTVRPNLRAFTILKQVPERAIASTGFAVLRAKRELVLPDFLICVLRHERAVQQMIARMGKGSYPSINQSDVENTQIPLPPLAVQKRTVVEIEGYQKVIDGARAILSSYHPCIPIDPDWPMLPIENLVADEPNSIKAGPFGSSLKKETYVQSGYKVYGQEQVIRGDASYGDYYISEEKYRELQSYRVKTGDVLISLVGTYGKTLIIPEKHEPGIINPRLLKLTLDQCKILPEFFVHVFAQESVASQVRAMSHGGTLDILNLRILERIRIPVPPLQVQGEIVTNIRVEQELVDANRTLVDLFEKKIRRTLDRIWGKDES